MMIIDTPKELGNKVFLQGWVNVRRDHGKITFIDLRDRSGMVQVVFVPGNNAYEKAKQLRTEYVVSITGIVNKRPEKMINDKIPTGTIEVEAQELDILNPSSNTPFEINQSTANINEEVRLKYRYLDLRSARMKNNVILRHNVERFFRDFLYKKDFIEIETPYLTKGTPEGAREFVVPSRLHPGNFYVLPQSPQQFKQLLMIAGMERYFQIVRCFRDEDQRGDRQPEFTQLDIEMSFVNREDILEIIEEMFVALVKTVTPNKKFSQAPFPRLTYKEVMEKYNTDKPDLRKDKNDPDELAFVWIIDVPLFFYSKTDKKLVSGHHPFTMPHEDDMEKLDKHPQDIRSYSYDLVLNGYEIAGGSIRIHKKEIQEKIFDLLGISTQEKQTRFGHILEAFKYGAPPHGGIAPGIDRIIAILANEPNIREVIPFPKTGDAMDLMMGAPSPLPKSRLNDCHIDVIGKEAKAVESKALETQTELVN